jgi:dTDP-4-dehydrorhamnose reductase
MRILVTGSNGLLGQKLTSLLQQDAAHYLIATARSPTVVPILKGEFHLLNITEAAQVDSIISLTKPDVIINTAAMTNVDQCETEKEACWKNNVTAVANLVDACEKYKVKLIHVSTDFIFDGSHGPLAEDEPAKPVNYYGESKLAAEEIVLKSNITSCILRTVLVYGITNDMSRSNIVLWVKKSLEEGKTINVVNDQFRTPTLAEDLAMGCYLAAIKNATGIYHISGKDFLSPYEIALATADYFQLNKSLIKPTDSNTFKQPAARPLITGFIIDKARKNLGYEPRSFAEGIAILESQLR